MGATRQLDVRILTHNIRYATSSPFKGERPWPERKQLLVNELLYNARNQHTLICLQEVLHHQLVDVLSGLNRDNSVSPAQDEPWVAIGVGRDDGKEAGEYSPIFYQPFVWHLHHWETVWLSETPKVPSKSWDAASIRIVTIGVFTHRASGKTVLALNTHLDDQGSRSRREAARIILDQIKEYRSGPYGDIISGIFLAGDFNSEANQEAYIELTAAGSPLVDTHGLVKPEDRYGNQDTYTGFGYEGEPTSRIDYILVGPVGPGSKGQQSPWEVTGYAVLSNRFDDGVLNSDHRAVVADVTL